MPEVEEGEWIAIPVAGAYHLSMSSNYNGARRPAVLWLEEGQAKLIIERNVKTLQRSFEVSPRCEGVRLYISLARTIRVSVYR